MLSAWSKKKVDINGKALKMNFNGFYLLCDDDVGGDGDNDDGEW